MFRFTDVFLMMDNKKRCKWANRSEEETEYHDKEWGVPVFDDRQFFEILSLDGAQAGLSWTTIIKKRENFRKAFDNFDVEKVACYDEKKIEELITYKGIIRNRLKINSVVTNAKAFIEVQKEFGSFSNFIWSFVNGKPIQNSREKCEDVPATTSISDNLSKELKKRGFKFVGSTICYALMQSAGLVNDHVTYCFRHAEIKNIRLKKE